MDSILGVDNPVENPLKGSIIYFYSVLTFD